MATSPKKGHSHVLMQAGKDGLFGHAGASLCGTKKTDPVELPDTHPLVFFAFSV